MNTILKRTISLLLVFTTVFIVSLSGTCVGVYAEDISSYNINGVNVSCKSVDDTDSSSAYAHNMYKYIWGEDYDSDFSSECNILRTMADDEVYLNPENLKTFIGKAKIGSVMHISNFDNLHREDSFGHSVIIVETDANGFTVFEYINERKESYYTWEYFCNLFPCECIKYIKCPVEGKSDLIYASADESKYTIPDRELYFTTPMLNGFDVCWVQFVLAKQGYEITVDGYYSQHTEKVVAEFQGDFSLEKTGVVDTLTLEKLKNPIKVPNAPVLSLLTPKSISTGEMVTVDWDMVAGAEYYNIYLYNSKNTCVDKIENINGHTASFIVEKPEVYTIKAKSVNSLYESELRSVSDKITVRSDITVTFVDSDGTVLNKQTIPYGDSAITPATPRKTGYIFNGWDKEYENVTSSITVRALYTPKLYTVKFIDYDGNYINTQKVKYGEAAVPPDITNFNEYKFIGWDKDFSKITENKTIKMVVLKKDSDLPITINSCTAVRAEEHSGDTITVSLSNNSDARVNGRVVVSLKTENGKFLTMTESSAFTIKANETKTMEVFVPYEDAAYISEVYVVEAYSTLLPISESTTAKINTEGDWTGWLPEDEAPENSYDSKDARIEYRYRTKATTTSSKANLAGWELDDTTSAWGEYGGWSGWTTNPISASESRRVNTKTETFVNGYNMRSYCTQSSSSPYYRQYRGYSIGGNYSKYGCRSSYGEFGRTAFWSPSTLNAAKKVPANTYSSACSYGGYNRDSSVGYAYGDYIWFIGSTSTGTTTYYQYSDRSLVYTYYYHKWSDWSEWSTNQPASGEGIQIETRETKRYLVNDPIEDDSGELKTITGVLSPDFAGKQATLFIYKIDDASDYTNEYVGQSVIDEDGRYIFTFKLLEEPSVKTGDYTVALGIEGASSLMYLDPIAAPKPEYTVNICDYDGSIIDTQQVKKGDSAILPEKSPERDGWIFAGWDYSNASIHENTNINALYVQKEYTVVYIDWTNELYELKTYHYGDPLIVPDIADTEGAVAVGWDAIIDGLECVKDNMIITAKYESKKYNVTFYDYDGNVIDTQIVDYGNAADIPDMPSTEKYVFLSWDSNDLNNVCSNLNVHPTYCFAETTETPVINIESGIYSDTLTISLNCNTEDSLIYYSINSGEEQLYTEPFEISETAEVSFYGCALGHNDSSVVNKYFIINREGNEESFMYPVKVYEEDGSLQKVYLVEADSMLPGEMLSVTKNGYDFAGYYKEDSYSEKWNNEIDRVNTEQSLYIKWIPEKYSVRFEFEDGTLINSQDVEFMASANAPKSVDVEEGYVFVGWNTDKYLRVTDNLTVKAIIKSFDEVASIKLDKTSLVMMKGLTYEFNPTVLPDDGKERTIVWMSDNEAVASVDENGNVTAKALGTATITAYMPEAGASANCSVKVTGNKYEDICLVKDSYYRILNGILFGVKNTENTVYDIAQQIDSDMITFKNTDGVTLSMDDEVGTGCKILLLDNNQKVIDEVFVVVTGDVNGDGFVNNKDVSKLARILVEKDTFTTYEKMAADVNADAVVNNRDAAMLSRYLVGKEYI